RREPGVGVQRIEQDAQRLAVPVVTVAEVLQPHRAGGAGVQVLDGAHVHAVGVVAHDNPLRANACWRAAIRSRHCSGPTCCPAYPGTSSARDPNGTIFQEGPDSGVMGPSTRCQRNCMIPSRCPRSSSQLASPGSRSDSTRWIIPSECTCAWSAVRLVWWCT